MTAAKDKTRACRGGEWGRQQSNRCTKQAMRGGGWMYCNRLERSTAIWWVHLQRRGGSNIQRHGVHKSTDITQHTTSDTDVHGVHQLDKWLGWQENQLSPDTRAGEILSNNSANREPAPFAVDWGGSGLETSVSEIKGGRRDSQQRKSSFNPTPQTKCSYIQNCCTTNVANCKEISPPGLLFLAG